MVFDNSQIRPALEEQNVWTECFSTYFGLSLQTADITYPSIKPIKGISTATKMMSGMKIIHITSLKMKPARTAAMMEEIANKMRPIW